MSRSSWREGIDEQRVCTLILKYRGAVLIKRMVEKGLFLLLFLSLLPLDFSESAAQVIENPAAGLVSGESAIGFDLGLSGREVRFSDRKIEAGSVRSLITASYGLTDRFSFYGAAGVGKINDETEFRGGPGLGYGGGISLWLYQWEDIFFGFTGQYLRFKGRDDDLGSTQGLESEIIWNEFNAALAGGSQSRTSGFYGGVLFSKVNGALAVSSPSNPFQEAHFNESKKVGLFWGGEVRVFKPFRLGVEVRLINEFSASLYLRYIFGTDSPTDPDFDTPLPFDPPGQFLEE